MEKYKATIATVQEKHLFYRHVIDEIEKAEAEYGYQADTVEFIWNSLWFTFEFIDSFSHEELEDWEMQPEDLLKEHLEDSMIDYSECKYILCTKSTIYNEYTEKEETLWNIWVSK